MKTQSSNRPPLASPRVIREMRYSARRRRSQAGQSAIIAVIVLFLLLFLGAIFIALIANNLRGTQRAANVSQSGRYAEAGINYLDQQLTSSPEGADWRPVPECTAAATCTLDPNDPDYFWLQPYHYDTQRLSWVGGFTRINFGGPTPGSVGPSGTSGGRALVRVTYRPDAPPHDDGSGNNVAGAVVDASGNQVSPAGSAPQPINKYIKLEAIGRAGQVVSNDPTTFQNSEGLGLRVEQVAYKAMGINEYALQATNKDNKPVTATLGPASTVLDRGQKREIESVIEGPVRFNTDLTFYGVNRFVLDPTRNDQIEVAGRIHLNGLQDNVPAASLTATDPTRVYINTKPAANDIGNLVPSGSPDFTTTFPSSIAAATPQYVTLVRDNNNGLESNLPYEVDPNTGTRNVANQNLRAVGKTQPPVIDASIGPNGLTRYRALTLNSAPLAPQFGAANDVNGPGGLNTYAGQYGWGQGMYLGNTTHIQSESEALVGGQSLRSQWLNNDPNYPAPYWQNDLKYEPPAVTIILTPRYMILRRFSDDYKAGQRGFAFRAPMTTGNYTAGQRLPDDEIIRYTAVPGDPPPSKGIPANVLTYEGYPADSPGAIEPPYTTSNHQNSYSGDFVIYAEGNIRIRGVAGGYDPETNQFFQRHLTVVSGGGNIYIDGNLLRDNIDKDDTRTGATEVRGKSTIALLAKNSVVVNTTQFVQPSELQNTQPEQEQSSTYTRILNVQQPAMTMRLSYGPESADNQAPRYVTRLNLPTSTGGTVPFPSVFLRHGPNPTKDANVFINVGLNEADPASVAAPTNGTIPTVYNQIPFRYDTINPSTYDPTNTGLPSYADPADTTATTLLLTAGNTSTIGGTSSPPALFDHTFRLPLNFVYGAGLQYPYNNPVSLIGTDNLLHIEYVTNHFNGTSTANYANTRVGVAPLDIRVEALMYAQEGTFFIIPGPWFNPDPNDTYERFIAGEPNSNPDDATPRGRRAGENAATTATALPRVSHIFPFYKEPMDIRMTFYGAISENLPAEVGDQSAWMEKWGWVPDFYGSTGLTGDPSYPPPPAGVQTVHGRLGYINYPSDSPLGKQAPTTNSGGSGIYYQFDSRAISPYAKVGTIETYTPLRPNPYFADQPLPLTPRLPVAPGLLYYGQTTDLPR